MHCKKCNKHRTKGSSTVQSLCTHCFDDINDEARQRGIDLQAFCRPHEITELNILGLRLFYWRGNWRAG